MESSSDRKMEKKLSRTEIERRNKDKETKGTTDEARDRSFNEIK